MDMGKGTKRTLARITFMWMAALVFALSLGAGASAPAYAEAPAPDQGTAQFETRFMTRMIDHHAMAIMMGEVRLEEAVHDELRSMCEDIITSQSQEIEMMQAWLADWYGVFHTPQMSPGDEQMIEHLASLEGAEFEIEFMQEMIKHHKMAVGRAMKCVQRAEHEALVDMCETMIETQQAEIAQLGSWLCEWYAICR